jgi:hypothetical protein
VAFALALLTPASAWAQASQIKKNERATINNLRRLVRANERYVRNCGGFAPSLASLGPPAPGSPADCLAAGLIDAELASGLTDGYLYIYISTDLDGNGTIDAYSVNANPVEVGVSGERFFYVDETGVIRANNQQAAGPTDPPVTH